MKNQEEVVDSEAIEVVNSDIVFQQDRAQVDTQVSTAHAYPRNITKAVGNAIAIVTMDKETAALCTYSVPRGGKNITGPSVHLAKILAQTWGNMRVEAKIVAIEAKQVVSNSVAWDLESNLAVKMEVRRSITNRNGDRFNDDLITVTGNAANSIALRNSVFAVIPRAVVDKVYKAAKQAITGDVSDKNKLIAERKKVIDGMKDAFTITDKEILGALGKAAIEYIDADDLVVLIGIRTAIKDGDTTVDLAFKQQTIAADKKESQKEKITNAVAKEEPADLKSKIEACTSRRQLDDLFEVTPDEQKTDEVSKWFNDKIKTFK